MAEKLNMKHLGLGGRGYATLFCVSSRMKRKNAFFCSFIVDNLNGLDVKNLIVKLEILICIKLFKLYH